MITGHSRSPAALRRAAFSLESLETRSLLSAGHFYAGAPHADFSSLQAQDATYAQNAAAPVVENSAVNTSPSLQHEYGGLDGHNAQPYAHSFQAGAIEFSRPTFIAVDRMAVVIIQYSATDVPVNLVGTTASFPPVFAGQVSFPGDQHLGSGGIYLSRFEPRAGHEYTDAPVQIGSSSSGTISSANDASAIANSQPAHSGSRSVPTLPVASRSAASEAGRIASTIIPNAVVAISNLAANSRMLEVLSGEASKAATAATNQFTPSSLSTTTLKLAGVLSGTRLLDWSGMTSAEPAVPQPTAVTASQVSTPMMKAMKSVLTPSRFYHITHLPNPLALLNDSLSNFADEAATNSATVVKTIASQEAALVTVSVIAADVAILTYFRRTRPQRRRAAAYAFDSNLITEIGSE